MDAIEIVLKRMDGQDELLKSILIQTTKTNGRVTVLEADYKKMDTAVESLKSTGSETKGSNKAWATVLKIVLPIAGIIITWYLSTHNIIINPKQ